MINLISLYAYLERMRFHRIVPLLVFQIAIIIPAFSETRDTLGTNSLLYSGTEYIKQFNQSKGTPFFPTSSNTGAVLYHGNRYENIDLLYDCQDDWVIVRDAQGLLKLRLVREKLEAFEVDNHSFVKLKLLTREGEFYEKFFDGKRMLLMQWKKNLELDSNEQPVYELRKTLFALQNGVIIPLDRSDDLYTIDPIHKRELKKVYRENKLNFKKDPVKAALVFIKEIEKNNW